MLCVTDAFKRSMMCCTHLSGLWNRIGDGGFCLTDVFGGSDKGTTFLGGAVKFHVEMSL